MAEAFTFETLCEQNVLLSEHSSYEIGGRARYYAAPKTIDELQYILEECRRKGIAFSIFGYGSNILFPDQPHKEKIFISLKKLSDCNIAASSGEAKIFLSAGVPLSAISVIGILCDYERLYFTHLLPGCIGAGVYINAKCYDDQMSGILNRVYYIDVANGSSSIQSIAVEDCQFAYKQSIFQKKSWVIIGADFMVPNVTKERYETIRNVVRSYKSYHNNITQLEGFYQHFKSLVEDSCKENKMNVPVRFFDIDCDRVSKQHFKYPSCGSVFKNNYDFGTPMGVIIEQLQLKGKERGGAMISPYHGNFIINHNHAKAADVKYLIQHVQEVVNNKHSFVPEPELEIIES